MEGLKYHRVLLKLSGEALSRPEGFGIDPARSLDIANRVRDIREMGVDVAIVIGAGNIWRGRDGGTTWFHPRACPIPGPKPALLMTLQSISGSLKPPRWPEATQVWGFIRIAASCPTLWGFSWTNFFHQAFLTLFLSSTPRGP